MDSHTSVDARAGTERKKNQTAKVRVDVERRSSNCERGPQGAATACMHAYGAYETIEGPTTVGHVQKFLGIYASMQIMEEARYLEEITSKSRQGVVVDRSLELGHIWKASLIIQITKKVDVKKYENEILKNLR